MTIAEIYAVYDGSDGDATKALYERLEAIGPIGIVATNLFRAQKNSARAKVYRGGGHRGAAYDRKDWAIGNLAKALGEHAEALGIRWGWGLDPGQPFHKHVLYVDLVLGEWSGGQVSFHTAPRGDGPDYPGEWDQIPNASVQRILGFCARVLEAAE
jgi:hypothetical protein